MADLSLDYERIYFENEPSRKTPINARTLNILDEAIYRLYQILRYGGVGSGGRQIELRNNGEYIQWRYVGDDVWTNLASLEELKGAKGDDGNGIVSMEKTSSDGPVDTYTVTFTDGSTFEFRVTNGLSSISSQNGLMLNDGGRRKVKSMISFIDDDCRKETFDKLFPLIKNLGIHYSVACAPGSLDDAENVYMKSSDLQTMYNSGFSVISHHYKQHNMDNTEAYPNYDSYNSNLENCQKRFAELGINDVMAVSYPQGRIVDEYIPSVKKHYKMGFTVDRGINEIPYESFYMKRCELFPENGAYTYLDAQQLVNEVALNGGWLIFMTHAWYPSFNEEVLSDLITYIKGLNIDIVDVNDAIEMTGNIIEIGHVKKPLEERAYPYYIVDANGRTWTNSVNLLEANDRELKEIKPAYLYGAYMNISGNVRSHDDTNRTVSLPVDVVPGEIYYLTCSAIYEQAIYLFYTSDGSVVEGGYRQPETNTSEGIIGNTVLINYEVIVPEGAATMRVSSNWNIQPDGYKIVKVIYPEEKEKGKNNLYGYDTSEQVDEKIRNNFPTYYFSVTKNEDGSYSSDKSYDDINSAYNGSKNLICNYETTFLNISEIITLKLGLVRHTDFDSARIYEFNCIDNDKQYTVCITKDSDSGNTIVTFSEVELGASFSGSAKDVTYDDTETKLGADNVQDAIGKVSEQKVDNPSIGAVGQILEIETVDDNGKPKTYKAVDKPQGGGEVTDEQVKDAVNSYLEENPIEVVSDGSNEYKWIPRGLMREQIRTFQGWTHCVRHDERLGKAVGVVMGGEASHEGVQPWYRVTIDDNGYMSEYEEIIVYDTDGSTQITPDNGYICGFCILSDGTYLMQDISFNFYKSTDYGKTLKKIVSSGHPTQAFGMRQLSTGRIISGCVSGYNRFYYSDDLGATWNESNVLDVTLLGNPPFEADSKYEFSEHCIVEFSNGTLLAIGRTSNNARDTSGTVRGHLEGAAVAYSDDKGATWRDFGWSKTITNMTSNNASCVCIDGIYHLVMGDRYTYTTDEQGNRRYFAMYYQYATEEDALNDNWSEPVVIDYGHWTEDATVPTDSGYPSLWKDKADNLHCVFYDGDGTGHPYGANWRLIDGSPVVESRAVSDEGNGSFIVSYSQAQVDAMLSAQKSALMKHINELYILVGQLPEVDDLDGSMYVTDGLVDYWEPENTEKWTSDNTGVISSLDSGHTIYALANGFNLSYMTTGNTLSLTDSGLANIGGFYMTDKLESYNITDGFTIEYYGGENKEVNCANNFVDSFSNVTGKMSPSTTLSFYNGAAKGDDLSHKLFTITDDEITLYVNGNKVDTLENTSDIATLLSCIFFTKNRDTGFAQARIYNRVLTDEEIKNNSIYTNNVVASLASETETTE